MTALLPNPQQERLCALPIRDILVVAPAGCGKTEALALRARAVIARGDVVAPRTILALTFSNKARDNLAARMRSTVGAGWRSRVTVVNFHGLAARLVKAHGRVVGIPDGTALPDELWRRRKRRELGVTVKNSDAFEGALRSAKAGLYTDEEVRARLVASGQEIAIAYEEQLRAEGRLDYDDLIRHAGRLLLEPAVARLYQAHFGMTLVDEFQDLSLLQYGIVRAISGNRTVYAGDPAQGIYSFAGAAPVEVLERIRALDPEFVEFTKSYRSSPAVLGAVNALAAEMGTTLLECGDPDRWPEGGRVVCIEREDTKAEAATLVAVAKRIDKKHPGATIGFIVRRNSRLDHFREAADQAGLAFEDWSSPTHVPKVVSLLKRHVRQASGGREPAEAIDELERLCRDSVDSSDIATLDEVAAACEALREGLADGTSLQDAIARCRAAPAAAAPVSPGLHLLNAHKGKGQEFEYVFVVGLEEGHIPDFRSQSADDLAEELRALHVMVSRARSGVVFTYSRTTTTKYGPRPVSPSRWLALLRGVVTPSAPAKDGT